MYLKFSLRHNPAKGKMVPDIVNISEAKKSDRRDVDNFHYPKDTIKLSQRYKYNMIEHQIVINIMRTKMLITTEFLNLQPKLSTSNDQKYW